MFGEGATLTEGQTLKHWPLLLLPVALTTALVSIARVLPPPESELKLSGKIIRLVVYDPHWID